MRRILEYAGRIGLDGAAFRACMTAKRPWPQIMADKCEGIRLGVGGTPTFFVNGRQLPDIPVYDDLKRIVDSITAATAATPAAAGRRR
jgi:protein-disulfide isomerase